MLSLPTNTTNKPRDSCGLSATSHQLNGSVKEPNKFHNYETEKIVKPMTRQNISSCSVLRMTYLMLFSESPPIYVSSCMTISDERTKQHVVIGFGELASVD